MHVCPFYDFRNLSIFRNVVPSESATRTIRSVSTRIEMDCLLNRQHVAVKETGCSQVQVVGQYPYLEIKSGMFSLLKMKKFNHISKTF